MSDSDNPSIDMSRLRGSSRDFFDYCTDELQRRRDSGEAFDEAIFREAMELVLRRLQHLEEEGIL
jgi:hypothetical protein